jgi:SpoVK/Ycf46/Vps4 family AAA+-type ATPase
MSKNVTKVEKGWSTVDDRIFSPKGVAKPKGYKLLPPGYYQVGFNPFTGLYFEGIELKKQDLIRVDGSKTDKIINDIKKFWTRRELFNKYLFPYKRGILMHGPPGCGKSCTIAMISEEIVGMGGVCLKFQRTKMLEQGLEVLRDMQPEGPVLVIMEDLDQLLRYNNMSELLNMLDGVGGAQQNVIYLATTNNPEQLHENIRNRPSRFDKRVFFGPPEASLREAYIKSLFLKDENIEVDIDKWTTDSEGLSFAHLKEMFISIILFGNDYDETIADLRGMNNPQDEDSGAFDEDEMYTLEDQENELLAHLEEKDVAKAAG